MESGLDVLHTTLALPMALRREVDDIPGILEQMQVMNEHHAGTDLSSFAGGLIGREILRKGLSELQSDAAPHNAHAIDRVDQGLDVGIQDVAMS
jgi:hypothetical protein